MYLENKCKTSDKHILEYTGDMSNPKVQRIVKHLNRALIANDYKLLHQMLVEDEIESLLDREKRVRDAMIADAIAEKDSALAEKNNALAAKDYWKALFEAEKQKNQYPKGK